MRPPFIKEINPLTKSILPAHKHLKRAIRLLAILGSALLIAACESGLTVSAAVRSGETVTVSLGNVDTDSEFTSVSTNIVRANQITAIVNDSQNNNFPVRVRHVFRLYGDPTALPLAQGGSWIAVIDYVNPNTGIAPNMATGQATLTLTSSAFNGPLVIDTEILPGTGSPHPFQAQDTFAFERLAQLVPQQQALVEISGNLPNNTLLGAAEYEFLFPDGEGVGFFNSVTQAAFPVGPAVAPGVYFADNTEVINNNSQTSVRVVLTALRGLSADQLDQFSFSIVSQRGGITGAPNYFSDGLVSVTYYDLDGNTLTGLTAQVGDLQ